MGSPFLELCFGYGVKVKFKSEVKFDLKSGKKSPLFTDYNVVRCLLIPECQGLLGWVGSYRYV